MKSKLDVMKLDPVLLVGLKLMEEMQFLGKRNSNLTYGM
ncbi:hypothetical protein VEA_001767 [Vibrio antiquarius]|uniref:Uncharacterized protein n=1 Tax=Vibrio antiquarius (strain Ex25) TaxID=150340 RepID=A0ACA6QI32_VIBAE|nr:hypothetical protein VEA_001767 [Vibrio antiquarius]